MRLARMDSEQEQHTPVCWASYLLYGDPAISYFTPADLRLIHEREDGEKIYPIPLVGELSLGRRNSNDIVIDKPTVSRKHLSIYRQGAHAVLDVVGQNGIELEGEKFRGKLTVTSLLRFELWGDWFRLEGLSLHEEEKPTTYIGA